MKAEKGRLMLVELHGRDPETILKFLDCCYLDCLWNTNASASARTSGSYTLQSAVQKLHGPRLFHPFFGFSYKSSKSQITVTITTATTSINLLTIAQASPLDWTHVSKNLTSVIYNWNEGQEFEVNLRTKPFIKLFIRSATSAKKLHCQTNISLHAFRSFRPILL